MAQSRGPEWRNREDRNRPALHTLPNESVVAQTAPHAVAPPTNTRKKKEKRKEKGETHGLLLERHQNHGRSVRAHAARHLLRGEADRAVAAGDDREGERSAAQAKFPGASGRNQKPRDACGTSLPAAWQRAQDGGLSRHRRHHRRG